MYVSANKKRKRERERDKCEEKGAYNHVIRLPPFSVNILCTSPLCNQSLLLFTFFFFIFFQTILLMAATIYQKNKKK
jgi:hypothetical protein